jgi:DNA (cytosine-5)-methyltransferase 1
MVRPQQQHRRPTAIDLFAGAGGLSVGLEQAGFDVVGAVEYDAIHMATHEYNFPGVAHLCASVSDISGSDILGKVRLKRGEVDLMAGGPPCQGFSLIGKRALTDSRNRLVFDFCRLVDEVSPRYFVMENVLGMKVGEHGGLLQELIRTFSEELGYRCRPVELLTATDFGVPQLRTRLFLVGARVDQNLPDAPRPTTKFMAGRRRSEDQEVDLPLCPTVWDALMDVPNADDFDELLDSDSVAATFGKASKYGRLMRGLDRDPSDFSYERARPRKSELTSSTRTVHTAVSIDRFGKTKPGDTETISRFLRLDPNGFCNTLRAGTDSKRGAYTSPRPLHPVYPRVITVREAARLHSFPDWFRLHVTKWHGFRQVGNAVAPLVGRAVGRSIIEALSIEPVRPVEVLTPRSVSLLSMNMGEASEHFGVPRDVIGSRNRKQKNTDG